MAFTDDTTYDEAFGPGANAYEGDLLDLLDTFVDYEYEDDISDEPVADDFTIQLARELDIDLLAILDMMDHEDMEAAA